MIGSGEGDPITQGAHALHQDGVQREASGARRTDKRDRWTDRWLVDVIFRSEVVVRRERAPPLFRDAPVEQYYYYYYNNILLLILFFLFILSSLT